MHCACTYTNNTRHSNHFTSIWAPFVNRRACAASSDRKGHCTSTDWAYFSFSRISSLAVLASVRVEVCSSQWLIVSAYAYFSSFLYFYFASANIYAAPIWPPNVFHLDENMKCGAICSLRETASDEIRFPLSLIKPIC